VVYVGVGEQNDIQSTSPIPKCWNDVALTRIQVVSNWPIINQHGSSARANDRRVPLANLNEQNLIAQGLRTLVSKTYQQGSDHHGNSNLVSQSAAVSK
jgi:hypothetical protein